MSTTKTITNNNTNNTSIYSAPHWAATVISQLIPYYFEVIKDGIEVAQYDLTKQIQYLIGRNADVCDIILEHPSISRLHAVVQFHASGRCFVYDMGSTHGTFWNKKRCKAFTYIPVRLGDQLSFGDSTRTLVLASNDARAEILEQTRKTQNQEFIKSEMEQYSTDKKRKRAAEDYDIDDDEKDQQASDDDEDAKAFEGEEVRGGRMRVEDEYINEDALFDDQDEYFDRTRRNEQGNDTVETIDTLQKKKDILDAKMIALAKQVSDLQTKKQKNSAQDDADELDSYVKQMMSNEANTDLVKLEAEMEQMKREQERLAKLIQLCKPSIDGLMTQKEAMIDASLDILRKDMFVEQPNKHKKRKLDIPPGVVVKSQVPANAKQSKFVPEEEEN